MIKKLIFKYLDPELNALWAELHATRQNTNKVYDAVNQKLTVLGDKKVANYVRDPK